MCVMNKKNLLIIVSLLCITIRLTSADSDWHDKGSGGWGWRRPYKVYDRPGNWWKHSYGYGPYYEGRQGLRTPSAQLPMTRRGQWQAYRQEEIDEANTTEYPDKRGTIQDRNNITGDVKGN